MNLKSGDMLYYEPHKATGILLNSFIREGITYWKYILRSPKVSDRQYILVNEHEVEADRIITAIKQGTLVRYACR